MRLWSCSSWSCSRSPAFSASRCARLDFPFLRLCVFSWFLVLWSAPVAGAGAFFGACLAVSRRPLKFFFFFVFPKNEFWLSAFGRRTNLHTLTHARTHKTTHAHARLQLVRCGALLRKQNDPRWVARHHAARGRDLVRWDHGYQAIGQLIFDAEVTLRC